MKLTIIITENSAKISAGKAGSIEFSGPLAHQSVDLLYDNTFSDSPLAPFAIALKVGLEAWMDCQKQPQEVTQKDYATLLELWHECTEDPVRCVTRQNFRRLIRLVENVGDKSLPTIEDIREVLWKCDDYLELREYLTSQQEEVVPTTKAVKFVDSTETILNIWDKFKEDPYQLSDSWFQRLQNWMVEYDLTDCPPGLEDIVRDVVDTILELGSKENLQDYFIKLQEQQGVDVPEGMAAEEEDYDVIIQEEPEEEEEEEEYLDEEPEEEYEEEEPDEEEDDEALEPSWNTGIVVNAIKDLIGDPNPDISQVWGKLRGAFEFMPQSQAQEVLRSTVELLGCKPEDIKKFSMFEEKVSSYLAANLPRPNPPTVTKAVPTTASAPPTIVVRRSGAAARRRG